MRLIHDLELALAAVVGEAGASPDPHLRALARDALVIARVYGLTWLDRVTVVHLEPDEEPTVLVEWNTDQECVR